MNKKITKTLILTTLLIIIFSAFATLFQCSYASTKTYDRPENTLGITKKIEITPERKYLIKNTPYVDAEEKIYDFANLFSDTEEDKLYKNVKEFIDKTNLDMVIVTINYNNKNSSMEYADDFYDYNDFGIGNNYDGILFLIDMDNRKMWISTTGSAIQIFDSHIDSILDDTYSYIKDKEYFECANTFISSSQSSYNFNKYFGLVFGIILAIVISILVPTIFCLIQKSKHKAIRLATEADRYLDKNSVEITNSQDIFIRSHTSKVARSSSSSGGGSHSRKQWH